MRVLIAVLSILCLWACSKKASKDSSPTPTFSCNSSPVQKGSRLLGYDILNSTQSGNFNDDIVKAKNAGMGFISLHLYWNQIESAGAGASSGTFADPGNALSTLSSVASANNLKLTLTISPIDIPARPVPSDLSSTKFDHPDMITRYEALIDYIFTRVDETILTSFSVGNEIDSYDWIGNGDSPSEYGTFLYAIDTHLNTYSVNSAFTGTLEGLTHGVLRDLGAWTALAGVVDVIHVTYYPLANDFLVKDPSVAMGDLNTLVNEFHGTVGSYNKPLYFQEVGYPSSVNNNSSETKQAQFFCNFFKAWDSHEDKIMQASILRFNDLDLSVATSKAAEYGLGSNTSFIEYLRTLGIRTYDGLGSDKKAFGIISTEASKRGW